MPDEGLEGKLFSDGGGVFVLAAGIFPLETKDAKLGSLSVRAFSMFFSTHWFLLRSQREGREDTEWSEKFGIFPTEIIGIYRPNKSGQTPIRPN